MLKICIWPQFLHSSRARAFSVFKEFVGSRGGPCLENFRQAAMETPTKKFELHSRIVSLLHPCGKIGDASTHFRPSKRLLPNYSMA